MDKEHPDSDNVNVRAFENVIGWENKYLRYISAREILRQTPFLLKNRKTTIYWFSFEAKLWQDAAMTYMIYNRAVHKKAFLEFQL